MQYHDEKLPNKIIKFVEKFCRLSKAPFAGQKITLLPYQKTFINNFYGTRNKETKRLQYKNGVLMLPKKNGKSSLVSCLSIFELLKEPGAEVYIIAPTIKQASLVFDEAAAIVEQDPELTKRIWVRRNLKKLEDKKQYSKLEVLAASPEISGFNASCIIFDEFCEVPKTNCQIIFDKIANACDARIDAHKIFISTAQFDKEHPGYHLYRTAKQNLVDHARQDLYAQIYEVGEHQDWKDPEAWRLANPASDLIFPFQTIEDDYKTVQASPIEEARFRTLRLNQWVGNTEQWIASDKWANCYEDFKEQDLFGSDCFCGIDYARRYDLCSYCLIIPKGEKVYVLPRFFIPRDFAVKKEKLDNVPYLRSWYQDPKANLFLTPGDVVDPSKLREQIKIDSNNFRINQIAFDPYGMEESRQLLETEGFDCVEIPQRPATMSPAVAHLERLVTQGRIRHNNNPILNWNIGNCSVRTLGGSDEIMLDKRKSTARIDGVTATVIGLTRILEQEKYYDSPILVF